MRVVIWESDEHAAELLVEGLLAGIPSLEEAGLRPTVEYRSVRGKKAKRRTVGERVDHVAAEILEG